VTALLYPANANESLTEQLFKNPGAEYRATPFWAWNCELNQDTLNRQIDCMKEMGFGGFHMHVRVGMTTEYLSDAFMEFIKGCTAKAAQNDMLAWLYDEDKWPSGFAGGLVTSDPALREKFLLFTQTPYGAGDVAGKSENDASARAARAENGVLLGKYAVTLDADGCLEDYVRLAEGDTLEDGASTCWYAYLETQTTSPWFNRQSYADTLSPKAIARFIEVTHERYLAAVGEEFGKRVPAIFTDEPQFTRKQALPDPFGGGDAVIPWTGDFTQSFRAAYGSDILDALPELFWELPDEAVSHARYQYHDHVAERFASAFADQIGAWCGKHNLMLTGHMMEEDSLHSQTAALGDCMRSYRGFQLPGIDMLCDSRNLNTAKQAQSAAHQYARPGVLSELYGVTNWDFPFRKHKLQGDWQAALGVSVRVPHLYWVSMRGEAKRDYPASIGHQSPWFKQYKYLEDHFARVNSAMTRGKPLVKIGVIHPVESYWLHWGPSVQTEGRRKEMDDRFQHLTEWLLYNQLDFDFICESLLPDQFDAAGDGFAVGAMHYDVVLAPALETIRSTTVQALRRYSEKGGRILFLGEAPGYVDAQESADACELAWDDPDGTIAWSKPRLLAALEPHRLLRVTNKRGAPAENLLSQWREEKDGSRGLFLCHVNDVRDYYKPRSEALRLTFRGEVSLALYDTLSGEIQPLAAKVQGGETILEWQAYQQDSLLLKVSPFTSAAAAPLASATGEKPAVVASLPAENPIALSEPNVVVLDLPAYSLDGAAWQGEEEVLRICDTCKEQLHMINDIARGCQPWVLAGDPDAAPTHTLRLRYKIQSEVAVAAVQLAVEDLDTLQISWNGESIAPVAQGYYVDEAIRTVNLPGLLKGANVLELTRPFGKTTTVESCYLLGDFGVRVAGRSVTVTEPVRTLTFGDWTSQGLPFYGGNVTYLAAIEADGSALALEAHHFHQPVLSVALDGEEKGVIALSPYRAPLGTPAAGKHTLALTAYGNRINTFGALHNINYAETWHGSSAWRGKEYGWSYEYRLRPSGVISAPHLVASK
jgi:hypothetical protein